MVHEIVAPERLTYTFTWEDQPDWETLVEIRLVAQGEGTAMRFRQAFLTTLEARDDHKGGWNESFDRLAAYLAS